MMTRFKACHRARCRMMMAITLAMLWLAASAFGQEIETAVGTERAEVTAREKGAETRQADLPAELVGLAARGQLTVRALRGWDRLPERFSQLALELRSYDIDLLGADRIMVEALVARSSEAPYLSSRINELRALAQLLASFDPAETSLAASISERATQHGETLTLDGVPGWVMVSAEERSGQNRDSHQRTFSFSLRSDGAVDRAQVKQSSQGYLRQVGLAFDMNWDEPPRYVFNGSAWDGRIRVIDAGSGVEYLSGASPGTDPRSGGFAVSAQYRSGSRPVSDRGRAATGRFSPDNPDSIGNPQGEATIRWPDQGCPGDQFTVEIRANGWSGRGTVTWVYEYHPNLLRSPAFSGQLEAQQKASPSPSSQAGTNFEYFRDCPECPEMVVIPAGSFLMGAPESDPGRTEHDWPRIRITIARPFAMAKTPITQAQWSALMDEERSRFKDCPDCPVDSVSHRDAEVFLYHLSRKTGHEYRLPSSAEWEYACRAGTELRYCGSNQVDEVAWYRCNSDGRTHPVAAKAANTFGLYDMSGNVMEWTRDCSSGNVELMPTDGSPLRESASCTLMISRGGSWLRSEADVRSAARSSGGMMGMGEDGFRPVRVLPGSDAMSPEGGGR
ncbi:formylglycine-generating enzyme family protein [Ectothiorhodospira lacustris]|uniref:formylglycine-generating enzyme family protein n=1 Tax=Ectothiorhodospira lacustris TaxID=2899127 RepID=UPI001EE9745E|nr:SUMF1/EgtB/PvdO family nonheme iron enzyme [Ectothiorhodospira lacustris]MCG5509732.1 formylglycine-generating enzyme family protein [Ectothiorhodospira lacustris]MCG5522354.1 formylglycine-generating enzyme family protein [Ectothiorhodospira lacustris]